MGRRPLAAPEPGGRLAGGRRRAGRRRADLRARSGRRRGRDLAGRAAGDQMGRPLGADGRRGGRRRGGRTRTLGRCAHRLGRGLRRSGRLGGGLLLGRFLGLDRTTEAFTVGLAPHPVGLGVLDRGGMALDPDAERHAQVERFLVRQAELAGKLVDADLLRHRFLRSFFLMWARTGCSARVTILAHLGGPPSRGSRRTELLSQPEHRFWADRGPQSPAEGVPLRRLVEAVGRGCAQPGTAAGKADAVAQLAIGSSHHPHQRLGRGDPPAADARALRRYAEPSSASSFASCAGGLAGASVDPTTAERSATAPGRRRLDPVVGLLGVGVVLVTGHHT